MSAARPVIPFSVPWLAGGEEAYVAEVFQNRIFGGHGPFTKRCMAWLETFHEAPRALLTTSCTGALEMAALLSGVGPGDEVIVPSYTFVATASAFLRCGATLVFAEVDPETMTLDPDDVARRITPRTRAVVPIHYGGLAADLGPLVALCEAHGLLLVEDAAQGLDATLDGRRLGTFAPLACFSFHETKNVHAGLAGALLVNDPAFVERAEYIWHRGTDRSRMLRGMTDKYTWVELGSSFYPAELQAAFLLAQLEGLTRNTEARGRPWRAYDAELRPLAAEGHFALPPLDPRRGTNHHAYWLRMPTPDAREALRHHLLDLGIQAYTHYVPLHSSPMGRKLGFRAEDLPRTELAAACLLRLPMHTELDDAAIERVIDGVRSFVRSIPSSSPA